MQSSNGLSDTEPGSAGRLTGDTFRDLFCFCTKTAPEKFERTLFRKTLYPHARLLAPIVARLHPNLFDEDFEVIRELSGVACADVFTMEVSRFHGRNKRHKSLLRTWFLIRVSGKRLLKWKSKCFPTDPDETFSPFQQNTANPV